MICTVNFEKNSYLFDIFKKKNGSTIAVKCGQLGDNKDSFMPIFSADTLDFQIVI